MTERTNEPDLTPRHPLRWVLSASLLLVLYAFVGGIVSFFGWVLDIPRLADWNNDGITIQPNAAIAVISAATALLLIRYGANRAAAVVGIFVFLIGASTIFQIVTEIDLGINTLFMFGREWGRTGVMAPGRMGTPGSTSWTLIGIAIVLIGFFRRDKRPDIARRTGLTAVALALSTLTISALSITGYIYGAQSLYTLPELTVIALQTATFIFAVSLAIVISIPNAGPMRIMSEDTSAGVMIRQIVPLIILIPILLGFLRLVGQRAGFYDLAFGTATRTLVEIGLLLILLWITARSVSIQSKRALSQADALGASEERRKLAQDAGSVGIWDWDVINGKTYWSENMWAFYGELPSELNPDEDYWSSRLHESDRARVKRHIREVAASGGDTYSDEFRILRSDGTIRWIEARAKVARDASGAAKRMYGVNLDCTEQKEIAERIRLSENQLRLVTDSVPALISYVDSDARYRFINKKYLEWFGTTSDEIVGKTVAEVVGIEAFATVKPSIERVLSGEEMTFEAELDYKGAGRRFIHASYVPDFAFDGTVNGFYGMVTDLSDLKHAQDMLQQAHDELEIRVKDRTKELADVNKKLVREMQEREIGERHRITLLKRLVAGQEYERRRIARDLHDQLGQRMTALRLKIASLSDLSDDPEQLAVRIKRLQEIAERLDSEVSFLAWELRPSTLDDLGLLDSVGAFVQEWSTHHETAAEFHSFSFPKERLESEIETHLYRITQEALNNVAKHANAKNVTVMLERRKENIILIIEDDGVGFKQSAKTASANSTKGLGLIGMSERAALIGGEVEIESAKGKGTTIYVRVPFST